MRRRAFVSFFGSTAAWSLAAGAQQGEAMRHVGILHDYDETDPEGRAQIVAFHKELHKLGWIEGRNVTFDFRLRRRFGTDSGICTRDGFQKSGCCPRGGRIDRRCIAKSVPQRADRVCECH